MRARAARRSSTGSPGTDRHQGVVAVVADFRYAELEDLLAARAASGRPPLLVVLDGVEDPHNLGAIIRSAHALGAHGVVIPKDRAVGVTAAVAKASAGAVERCPVARVTNVAKTHRGAEGGGHLVGRARRRTASGPSRGLDLAGPTALVLGSEGEGLRPLVRKTCDLSARHPHDGGSRQPLGVRVGGGRAVRGGAAAGRLAARSARRFCRALTRDPAIP